MLKETSSTKSRIIFDKIEIDGFNQDDNHYYDDEITFVSSTRKQWENLHGIDVENGSSSSDEEQIDDKNQHQFLQESFNEDDLIVVAVQPPHKKRMKNEDIRKPTIWGLLRLTSQSRLQFSFLFLMFTTGTTILIWLTKRFLRMRKLGARSRGRVHKNMTNTLSRRIANEVDDSVADDNDGSKILGEKSPSQAFNPMESKEQRHEFSHKSEPNLSAKPPVVQSSLIPNMRECNNIISQRNKNEKIFMAQQFAQDVQLVQEVLVENSLDPSIAPQLAISLQSVQHIVESQRLMCYDKVRFEAHQRHLDRQLSEEQHRERVEIAKYDPNWKEKLEAMRDKCYYWNALNGGVSRLWWEVLLIQQLARCAIPIWKRYFHDFHVVKSNANTSKYDNISLLLVYFLKDTVASVIAQICDCKCHSTTESTAIETEWGTSWMIPSITPTIFSSLLKQPLPAPIEYWTCYGYCITIALTYLFLTVICHQGLHILSLPPPMHHIVNCTSLTLFYGLRRSLNLLLSTLMRMTMMIPATDYNDTDFSGCGNEERDQELQIRSRSGQIGCSFLLLSLWVFIPLLSLKRTPALYRDSVLRITRADPVDFGIAYRNGMHQLAKWYQDQMALRYFFLSIYSSLILWEISRSK